MNKIFKILTTALTSVGLALGFAAAPANAESTPAALVRYTETMVERTIDPTTNEVQYLAGDVVQLSLGVSFKSESLSANIAEGDVLNVSSGITVVSGTLTGVSNYISFYGQAGSSVINLNSSSSTASFTLTSVPTSLSGNVNYFGNATSDVTIRINPSFEVEGYTFVESDFSNYNRNANTGLFMTGTKENAPVVGRSIDSSISFFPNTACVNTSGLSQGDILEATYDVNDGTNQVGEESYDWSVRNSQGMIVSPPGNDQTFEVPEIADGYKLTFRGDVIIQPVANKTYSFADYKVVKQGTSTNLLTHCKETQATGVLSASGTTVTGTLTTTADSDPQVPMSGFDAYTCTLYALADSGYLTPVKSAAASRWGQGGPLANPTCSVRSVPAGTYKMGIRGFSYNGLGSEKILSGTVTVNGSTPAPTKRTPKAATVATKVKVGKTFTISLHASKGTASKGANSDGLPAVVSVASASKAFCSVTKIVKSKKITGYTVKGLKAGKCSVVVAISGSSTFNASTKTTVVTVSK